MTLAELYDKLEQHDWFWAMSDDWRYWQAAQGRDAQLEQLAKDIPGGRELFDAFAEHYFSGPEWNLPRKPKPARPPS
jgi:hypothetical protein